MPNMDFPNIDEAAGGAPLPAGQYPVKIVEVDDTKRTRYGDEMWNVRMVVLDGPHKGRSLYDNWVFSEAAAPRIKLICSRIGMDTSVAYDVQKAMVLGRVTALTVVQEEYADKEGAKRVRNSVEFAGYDHLVGYEPESQSAPPPLTDEDVPF